MKTIKNTPQYIGAGSIAPGRTFGAKLGLVGLVVGSCFGCLTTLHAASSIQFASNSYQVAEGTNSVALTVQRAGDTNTLVSVDYATTNGTATAGVQYSAVSGTLIFAAGELAQTIVVPIPDAEATERAVTFQVSLANPSAGAVLGTNSTASVVLLENDFHSGMHFEFNGYTVSENAGSVLIGVVRDDDGNAPATVSYGTLNQGAIAGIHYTAASGTLTFAAGEKVKVFSVPILDNGLSGPTRTFYVDLSQASGGSFLGSPYLVPVQILNSNPGIQFEYGQYWALENGGMLTVKVVRGNGVRFPAFTVDYATLDGQAMAGQDYFSTTGTLAFAAGEIVKTVSVPIVERPQAGPDKVFTLVLSNPSNGGVLGPNATATVTILDTTGLAGHRFDALTRLADGSVQLTLGGGVSSRFTNYFDLYPIEVSTNLVDWVPLAMLERTNSVTNALTYIDHGAAAFDNRFYRMVTNNLVTPFRLPTGPFPVGMVSRLLTDSTRRNRYFISTNGSFMVSVWYPAVAQAGVLPGPLNDAPLARDPAIWQGDIDCEPYMVYGCLAGPPCATNQAPYPVVLYSPIWSAARSEISERGPELASHGYVVVSVDHFDAAATVFPDGTYLHGDVSSLSDAGYRDRVQDMEFVLDQLGQWNTNDLLFAGRLQMTNVATMGSSWGGGVAPGVARTDDRVRAAILWDPYFANDPTLTQLGLSKPQMTINSVVEPGDTTLYLEATNNAVFFMLSSSIHESFDDYYEAGLFGVRTYEAQNVQGNLALGRETASTLNAYVLWFLNKYLKGSTEPMPSAQAYPLVINLRQK